MCLGLEKYFDVKWVVDNDHLAAATLRSNKTNHDVQIYTEDLKVFLKQSFKGNPCYPKPGEVSKHEMFSSADSSLISINDSYGIFKVDHIHGSPPCKGFSRANRNGGKDDLLNNKVSMGQLYNSHFAHCIDISHK